MTELNHPHAPGWLSRVLLTPCLLVMLSWLGVLSLAWNLVAAGLYRLLPDARGRRWASTACRGSTGSSGPRRG